MRCRLSPWALASLVLGARSSGALAQPLSPLVLPEVAAPAPRVVTERGPSPFYYRRAPVGLLPFVRVGMGLHMRFATPTTDLGAAFAFDASGGAAVRLYRDAPVGALAEVGYTYSGFSEHLAVAGLGAVYGLVTSDADGRPRASGARLALTFHALAGSVYGAFTLGERSTVALGTRHLLVALAHQMLFEDLGVVHEMRLTITTLTPFGEGP